VIVTEGGDSTTLAAKNATSTIPVVFHASSDPVAKGLVASLACPGSNLTGVSLMSADLLPKLLELLLELVPQAKLIALLVDPSIPRDVEAAALAKGVQLHILKAVSEGEIDAAFATLVQLQAGGLIVDTLNRAYIAALASRHSIPAIAL
jgi:putative ABC transport system substrate-binding protein